MRVWLTQTGEGYPFQKGENLMRTGILAEELCNRGHDLKWWGSTFFHARKEELFADSRELKVRDNYRIHLLKGISYSKNVSLRRYFHHKKLGMQFRKLAPLEPVPDVIVVSMPPYDLAYEAVRYARKRGIPVIVDIRDLWPDDFMDFLPHWVRPLAKLVLLDDYRRTKYVLGKSNSLVAVSRGFLEWGLSFAQRKTDDNDKVLYLGASKGAQVHSMVLRDEVKNLIGALKNKKVFVFLGTFGKSYELFLLVELAKKFNIPDFEDVCFVLAGSGENFDLIKQSVKDLKNVYLPGWLKGEEISALLSASYAGMVPCRSRPNTINNKPIQYLAFGLPLISSLEGEMVGIIDKYKIGFSYKPGDLEELIQITMRLIEDQSLRAELSENAESIFTELFDATQIYKNFGDHIEKVAGVSSN